MKYIFIILGVIGAIVILVYLIGIVLPQSHSASVSGHFNVSNKILWEAITDVNSYSTWRSKVEKVEVLSEVTEPLRWREYYSNNDPLTFKVTDREDSSKYVVKIDEAGLPFGGTWTYQLHEMESGTRLVITEDGEIYNPFFRFVSKYIMGHDTMIKQFLSDLKKKFEKDIR